VENFYELRKPTGKRPIHDRGRALLFRVEQVGLI
jgi:hypothetical protein